SVDLFVDRAQRARTGFAVTGRNAGALATVCEQLEGLPLALELAAARAGVLTPAQMVHQLAHRLELLVPRRPDVAPRHTSMRAARDWSCQLLPPEVRRFFARLSVFRGGCTLEAAAFVCGEGAADWAGGDSTSPSPPFTAALDCLEELRHSSL